jgi:hypothetical protein
MNKPYPYQWALITGASSGIGESLARAFGRLGVSLVLIARSEAALNTIAEEIRQSGVSVITLPLDLIKPDSLDIITHQLREQQIEIDLLVNNAGFGSYSFFHELNINREMDMIQLNIAALVRFTHHFIQPMIRRNHGAVINISSTASFQPVPFMATYAATKAFVTSFTLALHSEHKNTNVSFITICPGRTKTQFQVVSGSQRITIKSRFATTDQVTRVTLNALKKKRPLVIEGWSNKIATHMQRFIPRKLTLALARWIFKPHRTQP